MFANSITKMKIHRQALTEMLNGSEEDQTMPGKTGMITAVQKNKETFLLPLKKQGITKMSLKKRKLLIKSLFNSFNRFVKLIH